MPDQKTLEQRIREAGGPVPLLRNAQTGPYRFPIPAEYSNWRDEQEAWAKTAILFDQSYHMVDLYLEGPDTLKLLSSLAINSFKDFGRNKAKQLVCCNHQGYLIGDAILFGLGVDRVNIVGRPPCANWVEFNARAGDYDVIVERDERSLKNPARRKTYRFEVQGPNAWKILEKVNGAPLEQIKFFNMGHFCVAGRRVRALRHGMSGAPGLEFWGPKEEGDEIKAVIMEAGREFGLKAGGARAYSTVAIESGWIPSPMPAIYQGKEMKPYREWLKADGFEANASLGGSFYSDNIEDYYALPWDFDYGRMLKFDHDFIGREALEKLVDKPHRRKVTLIWNKDDVARVFSSMLRDGERFKYMDLPAAHYSTLPNDMVVKDGEMIGVSTYPVYTCNGRSWISLAMIDEARRVSADTVSIIWGEPDGGTLKPTVERHIQTEIRASIAPCPFSNYAREKYRVDIPG